MYTAKMQQTMKLSKMLIKHDHLPVQSFFKLMLQVIKNEQTNHVTRTTIKIYVGKCENKKIVYIP